MNRRVFAAVGLLTLSVWAAGCTSGASNSSSASNASRIPASEMTVVHFGSPS